MNNLVKPVYYIDQFIDVNGSLWLNGVKQDNVPPLREMLSPIAALTREGDMLMISMLDYPVIREPKVRSIGVSGTVNRNMITLLVDGTISGMRPRVDDNDNHDRISITDVELLIPVNNKDDAYVVVVANDCYYLIDNDYQLLPFNRNVRLDDIKVIRNGVITTKDGRLFQLDCVNREIVDRSLVIDIIDAVSYRTGIIALDCTYQLWSYQDEKWTIVKNILIDSIEVRGLITCQSKDDTYETTYDNIHVIGSNGSIYELAIEIDIIRVGQLNIQTEAINGLI